MLGGLLTTLDGVGGGLQGDGASVGLADVHAEHHPHARVLPADVRLPLPQFDVRVPQLQNSGAVNSDEGRHSLSVTVCTHQSLWMHTD